MSRTGEHWVCAACGHYFTSADRVERCPGCDRDTTRDWLMRRRTEKVARDLSAAVLDCFARYSSETTVIDGDEFVDASKDEETLSLIDEAVAYAAELP